MSEKNPVLNDFPDPCFNAFIMMRFRETDTHRAILDALSSSLAFYGINALRADQRSYCDSLWGNVRFYIEACDLGIAVFEQLDDKDFNPNVSLELGYMMARRKKFLLLKEASLPSLPTDIVGNLYQTFLAQTSVPQSTRQFVAGYVTLALRSLQPKNWCFL